MVFMQGCPLRCHCCHNPETWKIDGGFEISDKELLKKILHCEKYFGSNGGVTFSGGEPLLQADFLYEFITVLKDKGINVAIDTSGCILNDKVKDVLRLSDLILLDCKYTNNEDYLKYTGMSLESFFKFIEFLESIEKPVWLRQVIIPSINDNASSLKALSKIKAQYQNIQKIELLPFRKLCIEKYKDKGISFPFENIPEATKEDIQKCLDYM